MRGWRGIYHYIKNDKSRREECLLEEHFAGPDEARNNDSANDPSGYCPMATTKWTLSLVHGSWKASVRGWDKAQLGETEPRALAMELLIYTHENPLFDLFDLLDGAHKKLK